MTRQARHDADILFGFVLAGEPSLDGRVPVAGDAFTLPPAETFDIGFAPPLAGAATLEWLEVALPGTSGLSDACGENAIPRTRKGRP